MPRTRYTVRLPPALDAAVQERLLTTRTPFAVFVREALSAYLAATAPTSTPPPDDGADILRDIQTRLAALTVRVEAMEEELRALTATARATTPPPADRHADRSAHAAPTGADTPPPSRRGRRPSPLHQQILALLQRHPEGLRAEEIRVYVQARRPIGDILQGMVKGGVIAGQGRGLARRYVLVAAYEARRLRP